MIIFFDKYSKAHLQPGRTLVLNNSLLFFFVLFPLLQQLQVCFIHFANFDFAQCAVKTSEIKADVLFSLLRQM